MSAEERKHELKMDSWKYVKLSIACSILLSIMTFISMLLIIITLNNVIGIEISSNIHFPYVVKSMELSLLLIPSSLSCLVLYRLRELYNNNIKRNSKKFRMIVE